MGQVSEEQMAHIEVARWVGFFLENGLEYVDEVNKGSVREGTWEMRCLEAIITQDVELQVEAGDRCCTAGVQKSRNSLNRVTSHMKSYPSSDDDSLFNEHVEYPVGGNGLDAVVMDFVSLLGPHNNLVPMLASRGLTVRVA